MENCEEKMLRHTQISLKDGVMGGLNQSKNLTFQAGNQLKQMASPLSQKIASLPQTPSLPIPAIPSATLPTPPPTQTT